MDGECDSRLCKAASKSGKKNTNVLINNIHGVIYGKMSIILMDKPKEENILYVTNYNFSFLE